MEDRQHYHRTNRTLAPWRQKIHEVIFEADTFWGKFFDVSLLVAILLSVLAVMLESVNGIAVKYGHWLTVAEWVFTILFTIEYIARIISVGKPLRYMLSFFGLVDLLSIAPTYLGLFLAGPESLRIIRVARLIRVFRIFKLARYLGEANELKRALVASRPKIVVFLGAVLIMTVIVGTLLYLVEGAADHPENGFTSIPRSIYWAIVTMTTVGYGDVVPHTALGQTIAAFMMIVGYGIIAVPTGIVSAEMAFGKKDEEVTTRACPECAAEGHDHDAIYCKNCGAAL